MRLSHVKPGEEYTVFIVINWRKKSTSQENTHTTVSVKLVFWRKSHMLSITSETGWLRDDLQEHAVLYHVFSMAASVAILCLQYKHRKSCHWVSNLSVTLRWNKLK